MFYFVCLLHWITNENYYYSLSNMFELILNVFINRDASGGSSMLAGESNQGTVENFISCQEVVKDSSILGSRTNIKNNLTTKEKRRLRNQKY